MIPAITFMGELADGEEAGELLGDIWIVVVYVFD